MLTPAPLDRLCTYLLPLPSPSSEIISFCSILFLRFVEENHHSASLLKHCLRVPSFYLILSLSLSPSDAALRCRRQGNNGVLKSSSNRPQRLLSLRSSPLFSSPARLGSARPPGPVEVGMGRRERELTTARQAGRPAATYCIPASWRPS